MSTLVWGASGSHNFETGVDRGVLYAPGTGVGVPWNGLKAVKEKAQGGDPQAYYHDGIKFLQISAGEDFSATIEAFSAPVEFASCDGTANIYSGLYITQQPRKQFGVCYRTLIGNELEAHGLGYKLHIVYNALARPTNRDNLSLGSNAEPLELSWDVETVPLSMSGFRPTAHIVINSLTSTPGHMAAMESILYGSEGVDPRQPTFDEVITIFETAEEDLFTANFGETF